MTVATQTALRDLNQTNRELRRSKLITQQRQHRLSPCPIGPTSLTARHSSRGIDRNPLHESAPELSKLIGGQRNHGARTYTYTRSTGNRKRDR